MVWLVEWSQPGQQGIDTTVWNTKAEALAAACAYIMDNIKVDWDLTEPDENDRALLISDECAAGNWSVAIDLFNEWEADGEYEWMEQYRVYEAPIQKAVPAIHLLRPGSHITVPNATPVVPAQPFVATTPGATCRGPCKNPNPHAYADRSDGTYCCYQCRMMSQVFGGTIP